MSGLNSRLESSGEWGGRDILEVSGVMILFFLPFLIVMLIVYSLARIAMRLYDVFVLKQSVGLLPVYKYALLVALLLFVQIKVLKWIKD